MEDTGANLSAGMWQRSLLQAALGAVTALSCWACDCIAPPVRKALDLASAVFTGKVVEKKELPPLRDNRRRYAVRFAVEVEWKGKLTSEAVVYDAAPRGDCQGYGFQEGKHYVVFASRRAVGPDIKTRIEGREIVFPDLWNGVLPIGSKILIGEICTRTAESGSESGKDTIRLLGPPRRLH